MGKKINLPLLADDPPSSGPPPAGRKPSIAVARARLGGKPDGEEPAAGLAIGQLVTFSARAGNTASGVVLYASSAEAHVLLDAAHLRRLPPHALTASAAEPSGELGKVAADARMFALLVEGQPVRYATDAGALNDGTLIEKCRYGALVLRGDGGIVAVGFRKLWPAPAPSAGAA